MLGVILAQKVLLSTYVQFLVKLNLFISFIFMFNIIAVRLRPNKKVQNLNEMWYEDVVQTHTTQGDFGLESP